MAKVKNIDSNKTPKSTTGWLSYWSGLISWFVLVLLYLKAKPSEAPLGDGTAMEMLLFLWFAYPACLVGLILGINDSWKNKKIKLSLVNLFGLFLTASFVLLPVLFLLKLYFRL